MISPGTDIHNFSRYKPMGFSQPISIQKYIISPDAGIHNFSRYRFIGFQANPDTNPYYRCIFILHEIHIKYPSRCTPNIQHITYHKRGRPNFPAQSSTSLTKNLNIKTRNIYYLSLPKIPSNMCFLASSMW